VYLQLRTWNKRFSAAHKIAAVTRIYNLCYIYNVIWHGIYVLYSYINNFRNVCRVQYGCSCSSLISCIAGRLLRYCLSDYEMLPVAPTISGITLLSHSTRPKFVLQDLYIFRIFSTTFLITFLCPEIAKSINTNVPFYYHELWCPIYC